MTRHRIVATFVAALTLIVTVASGSSTPAAAASTKDPVIIVAGFLVGPLFEGVYAPLEARLESAGYDVTVVTQPDYGFGDIHDHAARLSSTVASVKARTGAAKVDLIGHSMGGLVIRTYVRDHGGAPNVDSMITLGSPHYGTSVANVATFLGLGSCLGITACQQMATGSAFLNQLNAGDDTIGSVRYTAIATIFDELVIPYSNGFLSNDGNLQNVTVQAQCPLRVVGHLTLVFDGAVYDGIRDALRGDRVRMNCWAL